MVDYCKANNTQAVIVFVLLDFSDPGGVKLLGILGWTKNQIPNAW